MSLEGDPDENGPRSVTPGWIAEEIDVSERTARDILKTMANEGLVQEDRIPDGRVRYIPDGLFARDA